MVDAFLGSSIVDHFPWCFCSNVCGIRWNVPLAGRRMLWCFRNALFRHVCVLSANCSHNRYVMLGVCGDFDAGSSTGAQTLDSVHRSTVPTPCKEYIQTKTHLRLFTGYGVLSPKGMVGVTLRSNYCLLGCLCLTSSCLQSTGLGLSRCYAHLRIYLDECLVCRLTFH